MSRVFNPLSLCDENAWREIEDRMRESKGLPKLDSSEVSYTTTESTMGKYTLRKADELLIRVLEAGHSNVVMLTGNPGTGKTFFTKCYAEMIKAEYIYTLCHESTNSEDLFYSVNVGKAFSSDDVKEELPKSSARVHKEKLTYVGGVKTVDEFVRTLQRVCR